MSISTKKILFGFIVYICLPAAGNAANFDFQQWIQTNGEQGFNNSAPFNNTDNGLTLTATAFELPVNTNSNVYMDGYFNNVIGGMGVCSILDVNAQCAPSSDAMSALMVPNKKS